METKNLMIVGVGGQGSLLASKILGHLLVSQGYDVKVSEVHGMSQRGGSVVTYVRFGDKIYSPIVDKGEADFIVSFEQLEAARWLEYLKPDGQIVTNTQQMEPMPVIAGLVSGSGSGFGSGSGVGGIGSTSSPSSPFVFPKFSELPELLFVELSSLFSSSLLSSSVFPCPGQVSFVKVSLSKYSVMEGHPFTASFPVWVQIVLCTTEAGGVKFLYSNSAWMRSIMCFHITSCHD